MTNGMVMQQDRTRDSGRYFGIYRRYRTNDVTYRTAVLWDQAGWHWRAYESLWGGDGEIRKEFGKLVAQGGPFPDPYAAERDANSWIQGNVAGVVDVFREVYSWAQG